MSLSDEKRRACQEISIWLKQADIKAGNTIHSDLFYYAEAERRIKGFRWQLYKLNRPFVWLEKTIIEPLDFWSDRANVFQFFAKVSPLLEAIGVLAIPFVLFYYENQRENRQIKFEQNVIESQAEVRQQEAVRDYLSQISTIYLDGKGRDEIKQDEDLKNLLEATTLAIFDELSVSETFQDKSKDNDKLNQEAWKKDRKGDVINFLYKLDWINSDEPLISLSKANLFQTNLEKNNLREINLKGANLSYSKLIGTKLIGANLSYSKLIGANMSYANLIDANLSNTNISNANLYSANLSNANLSNADLFMTNLFLADLGGANLSNATLRGAIFCQTIMPDKTINNKDCKDSKNRNF